MPQIKFKNNFRKKSPQRYNKDMRKQVLSSSYFLLGEIKRLSISVIFNDSEIILSVELLVLIF